MGKCILCEKETKNNYSYFSADIIDRAFYLHEYDDVYVHEKYYTSVSDTEEITFQRTTYYTNLQKHFEYLCSNHIRKALSIVFLIAASIIFGMCILFAVFSVAFTTGENTFQDVIGGWLILGIILSAPFFISFLFQRYHIKKDTRFKDEGSARRIYTSLKSIENKAYFTPDERYKLKALKKKEK
ncbi:MAG: hypothetical protein FWD48_00110 [Oscillospiraceae bacterium]|nr:hypothetical protein [Oscillospiraceae bacterium]